MKKAGAYAEAPDTAYAGVGRSQDHEDKPDTWKQNRRNVWGQPVSPVGQRAVRCCWRTNSHRADVTPYADEGLTRHQLGHRCSPNPDARGQRN
jgi:hypothetical protein